MKGLSVIVLKPVVGSEKRPIIRLQVCTEEDHNFNLTSISIGQEDNRELLTDCWTSQVDEILARYFV